VASTSEVTTKSDLYECDYYSSNFFDPGTQFQGNEKNTLCSTKKYKNQAGMKL